MNFYLLFRVGDIGKQVELGRGRERYFFIIVMFSFIFVQVCFFREGSYYFVLDIVLKHCFFGKAVYLSQFWRFRFYSFSFFVYIYLFIVCFWVCNIYFLYVVVLFLVYQVECFFIQRLCFFIKMVFFKGSMKRDFFG